MTDTETDRSIISEDVSPGTKALREGIAANKWLPVLEIAAVFSPVLLVIAVYRILKIENPMLMIAAVWIANLMMLLLIWGATRMRGASLKSIGLSFEWTGWLDAGRAVLKSIPVFIFAVFAFVLGTIVMANLAGIPEGADLTKYNYLHGNLPLLLLSLAGVYIVSSFGEEIVYRGFLITRVRDLLSGKTRFALFISILVSSIVFGFAHFEWGLTGIVQTGCMGAALALSFLWTKGSLWPLILAHCYLDTLLLVPLYFANTPAG